MILMFKKRELLVASILVILIMILGFISFSTNFTGNTLLSSSKLDAKFISQNVPTSMIAGQKYTVSVTMKNVGATRWTKNDGFKLGSENPRDNLIWGFGRVELDSNDLIKKGNKKVFKFDVVAPSTPGKYNFQWRMLKEKVRWFGDKTSNVKVKVISEPNSISLFVEEQNGPYVKISGKATGSPDYLIWNWGEQQNLTMNGQFPQEHFYQSEGNYIIKVKAYKNNKLIAENQINVNILSYIPPKLIGNKKLLIIEFAPRDTAYGTINLCYNPTGNFYFFTDLSIPSWCPQLIDSRNFLEVINNPSDQISFQNTTPINIKPLYSLSYLNSYLKKEAIRNNIPADKIPKFDITFFGPPIELIDIPPKTTGISDYYLVDNYFYDKIRQNSIDTKGYDAIAIIYLDDESVILGLNPDGTPIYPGLDRHYFINHADSLRKTVFLTLKTGGISSTELETSQVMIHEIMHIFGAGDDYISGENPPPGYEWCHFFSCCTIDGIPNPNIFPQTKGCLMCADSPILMSYSPYIVGDRTQSLDQVAICDKTITEIGWVIK